MNRRLDRARAARWAACIVLLPAWLGAQPLASQPAPADAPQAQRRGELIRLLRQDCGSCHGLRLTGGLGPPLTAAALAERPAEQLEATILQGRPGTAMPPWAPFMTEGEVRWLVGRLRVGEAHDGR